MNISDVITELKSDAWITAVLGTRIYERPNPNNTQAEDWTFLTIRNLDESPDYISNAPLLSFVFSANDRKTSYDTLNSISDTVFNYINGTNSYNGFELYGKWALRKFPNWVLKTQRYTQFDMRFYFTK